MFKARYQGIWKLLGSGGKTSRKFLKICIQLWLRMPLPAVFKHFLVTKTLLPTLQNHSLLAFQESQRPLLDRSALPPPQPILLHFCVNLEDQLFEKWGGPDPPIPPLGYATGMDQVVNVMLVNITVCKFCS